MHDTLEYVKRLEAVGIPREQAEAQVRIMSDVINTNLVTKRDLSESIHATRADFAIFTAATREDALRFKAEMHSDFEQFRTEMRSDFEEFRTSMRTDFAGFRAEMRSDFQVLRADMARLEDRMTIKLGAMMVVGMGLLFALLKLT